MNTRVVLLLGASTLLGGCLFTNKEPTSTRPVETQSSVNLSSNTEISSSDSLSEKKPAQQEEDDLNIQKIPDYRGKKVHFCVRNRGLLKWEDPKNWYFAIHNVAGEGGAFFREDLIFPTYPGDQSLVGSNTISVVIPTVSGALRRGLAEAGDASILETNAHLTLRELSNYYVNTLKVNKTSKVDVGMLELYKANSNLVIDGKVRAHRLRSRSNESGSITGKGTLELTRSNMELLDVANWDTSCSCHIHAKKIDLENFVAPDYEISFLETGGDWKFGNFESAIIRILEGSTMEVREKLIVEDPSKCRVFGSVKTKDLHIRKGIERSDFSNWEINGIVTFAPGSKLDLKHTYYHSENCTINGVLDISGIDEVEYRIRDDAGVYFEAKAGIVGKSKGLERVRRELIFSNALPAVGALEITDTTIKKHLTSTLSSLAYHSSCLKDEDTRRRVESFSYEFAQNLPSMVEKATENGVRFMEDVRWRQKRDTASKMWLDFALANSRDNSNLSENALIDMMDRAGQTQGVTFALQETGSQKINMFSYGGKLGTLTVGLNQSMEQIIPGKSYGFSYKKPSSVGDVGISGCSGEHYGELKATISYDLDSHWRIAPLIYTGSFNLKSGSKIEGAALDRFLTTDSIRKEMGVGVALTYASDSLNIGVKGRAGHTVSPYKHSVYIPDLALDIPMNDVGSKLRKELSLSFDAKLSPALSVSSYATVSHRNDWNASATVGFKAEI